MALTGHMSDIVLPIVMVCPRRNGSVFDSFIRIVMNSGVSVPTADEKVMLSRVKWIVGSNFELQVSSPSRRKPKKAKVMAAQIRRESKFCVVGMAKSILKSFKW